eukprot:1659004-Prymnesium_polylepis.2
MSGRELYKGLMLVRQCYSHDPPAPWGMWLYQWILKPASLTAPCSLEEEEEEEHDTHGQAYSPGILALFGDSRASLFFFFFLLARGPQQ